MNWCDLSVVKVDFNAGIVVRPDRCFSDSWGSDAMKVPGGFTLFHVLQGVNQAN